MGAPISLRQMTEQERAGFLYALRCLRTWADQIEGGAPGLAQDRTVVPLDRQIADNARFARGLARALEHMAGPPP